MDKKKWQARWLPKRQEEVLHALNVDKGCAEFTSDEICRRLHLPPDNLAGTVSDFEAKLAGVSRVIKSLLADRYVEMRATQMADGRRIIRYSLSVRGIYYIDHHSRKAYEKTVARASVDAYVAERDGW